MTIDGATRLVHKTTQTMAKWGTLNIILLFISSFTAITKEESPDVIQHVPKDSPQPPDVIAGVSPESMSMTLTQEGKKTQNGFIQIFNPPEVIYDGYKLEVQYQCIGNKHVGIQLNVWTDKKKDVSVFSQMWNCTQKTPNQYERRVVTVKLKGKLSYRPSHWNPVTVPVQDASLRAWVVDSDAYHIPRWSHINFKYASANVQYAVRIPPPYQRMEAPSTKCYTWWQQLQFRKPYLPKCPLQPEVVVLVKFPLALSGTYHGVIRSIPNFTNPELEAERLENLGNPRWTMVFYLYIIEYCPSGRHLCSIFQRLKWNDLYMTPIVYVNQLGQLHLQLVCESGEAIAHLTPFSLPKHEWVRLVVSMENNRWFVTINYGKNWKDYHHTVIRVVAKSRLWYDSFPSLHIIGGSEITPSFQGYVGHARIYRRMAKDPRTIPYPKPDHAMFRLGIGEKAKRCKDMLSWINYRINLYRSRIQKFVSERQCPGGFFALFPWFKSEEPPLQCDKQAVRRSAAYRFVRQWVRKQSYSGWQFKLKDVGAAIYEHATELVDEEGFERMAEVVQLLKQSSCYGNHDASFMLSSILNHGVGVKADEIMAQHYLMMAAHDNHRLSLLTLGNKNTYGLDGIPQDLEQAYVYYKNMADVSRRDREEHAEDGQFTEHIRLTDEYSINEQTDEEGDLFLWFQHQAAQGVVRAQRDLARIMFWGSQGVKRNIKAAVEYYRISAQSGVPSALFDYGIVLLKGQGTPQNYTGALYYLRQAAEKGHAGALNALGWYALEVAHNYTEALELFNKSRALGNADASHNLGHMLVGGRYPGSGVDRIKAFEYFSEAALKGQHDSSLMIATYNMRGHPSAVRNADIAISWSRYVCETNPALGKVLSKGLKAYRHQNWPASILYYMLAADAGLEVGLFNLAMLCEENHDGVTSFIEKECVWKFYKLATQREPNNVNSYSWIKMGDYHWYGCEGKRDPKKAVVMYANAALKGDPHAIFNLGFLVEEGLYIPTPILNALNIPDHARATNVTLLRELYHRCKESYKTEAFLPCSLALIRVEVLDLWSRYHLIVTFSTILGAMVGLAFTAMSVQSYIRGNRRHVDNV